jgi:hypothetical protein
MLYLENEQSLALFLTEGVRKYYHFLYSGVRMEE